MRKQFVFAAILTAALALTSACGASQSSQPSAPASGSSAPSSSSGGSSGAAKDPIKIGVLQPLTGGVSDAGHAISDAIKIAADEINAAGGVNGRQIQLVTEDTANDPATCSAAAEKVITRDKVVAIIGAWGSSCTLAVNPVVGQHKVPMLSETASSFKVTSPKDGWNEYVFRIAPPTPMEGQALKGHVKDVGIKSAYFLAVNNDWGRGTKSAYGPIIEAEGGKVVGEAFFKDDETNFQPLLSKADASGADTIVITTDAAQIAVILEQAKALGLKEKFLTTGGSNFPPKVISVAKDAGYGEYATIFYAAAYDPNASANPERARAFNKKWTDTGHQWADIGEAARGYDAMYTMAEAAKIAKSIDPQGMRDALAQVHLKGIMYGDISFGDWTDGTVQLKQQNKPSIYIVHVKDDKNTDIVAKWPS